MKIQNRSRIRLVVAGVMVYTALVPASYAQRLFSYVDEQGVRTFTNIAPNKPVQDLRILGTAGMPIPATEPAKASKGAKYDPIIEKYAGQYQLDPSLIRSMIVTESGFQERAVSRKGAQGLMQLMPGTAARIGVRNVFDPEENIHGGVKHMRKLMDMFENNLPLSLAAYNAGENLVHRVKRVPNIPETQNYVRNITTRYGKTQAPPKEASNTTRPVYRYYDRNGVLHLTNVPQIPRNDESLGASWTPAFSTPGTPTLQVP